MTFSMKLLYLKSENITLLHELVNLSSLQIRGDGRLFVPISIKFSKRSEREREQSS